MSKTVITKTPTIKKDDIRIDCNHTAYLASMHIIAKDQKVFLLILQKYLMILELKLRVQNFIH